MLQISEYTVYRPTERWKFQWAPTLGGECYILMPRNTHPKWELSFNGHPPLGVNATNSSGTIPAKRTSYSFQWAPTLGGECYGIVYLITPPFVKGSTRFLTFPHDFELNALREPRRDLNSRAILEEVRAKSVFRWRGWCRVFLGAFLSSKLGGVLGVVWGVLWRQVQLFSVAKYCAKVGRHLI